MTDETRQIIEVLLGGAGGVTLWKLVENWQKHRFKKDETSEQVEKDKDKLIEELRGRISQLEIDNAKKEAWLSAFREMLENGSLVDKIKELTDG